MNMIVTLATALAASGIITGLGYWIGKRHSDWLAGLDDEAEPGPADFSAAAEIALFEREIRIDEVARLYRDGHGIFSIASQLGMQIKEVIIITDALPVEDRPFRVNGFGLPSIKTLRLPSAS